MHEKSETLNLREAHVYYCLKNTDGEHIAVCGVKTEVFFKI